MRGTTIGHKLTAVGLRLAALLDKIDRAPSIGDKEEARVKLLTSLNYKTNMI
jgi:hypothetical protein